MLICYEIIMYLHDESQKITYFENNVLYLDFFGALQNHCLFQQLLAKIMQNILEITCKEFCVY